MALSQCDVAVFKDILEYVMHVILSMEDATSSHWLRIRTELGSLSFSTPSTWRSLALPETPGCRTSTAVPLSHESRLRCCRYIRIMNVAANRATSRMLLLPYARLDKSISRHSIGTITSVVGSTSSTAPHLHTGGREGHVTPTNLAPLSSSSRLGRAAVFNSRF